MSTEAKGELFNQDEEPTGVVVREQSTTPPDIALSEGEPSIGKLMELAIVHGGPAALEVVERLTALKNAQEDRDAKRVFSEHFAVMQSQYVAIVKNHEGYEYKYAKLGTLQAHFGKTIANNGFTYWFSGHMLDENGKEGWKRIELHISGWGHERVNHFDVPPIDLPRGNEVQALGAADTYGMRYAFIAGFGLPIQNAEDTDGVSADDAMEYAEFLRTIKNDTDIDELYEHVKEFRQKLNAAKDTHGFEVVMKAYTARKQELQS